MNETYTGPERRKMSQDLTELVALHLLPWQRLVDELRAEIGVLRNHILETEGASS